MHPKIWCVSFAPLRALCDCLLQRAEVAGTVVSFLDQLEPWVAAQTTLELIGSSLLIVYEGDTTVVSAQIISSFIV